MKELSIEQKAKAYDKALERVKDFIEKQNPPAFDKDLIGTIFPELVEGEDEKIRKEIIDFATKANNGVTSILANNYDFNKWIAWLEKQGRLMKALQISNAKIGELIEKNYYLKEQLEKQGEQKSDKVEPKFKVGDFIVNDYCMGKVIELTDDAYLLDTGQGILFSCEHNAHLWTIQDAKDGDVLATKAGGIFIYKELLYNKPFAYCGVDKFGVFKDCNCGDGLDWTPYLSNVTPATKEQRDLLFKKMKESGYEWDAEKKELKKIESTNITENFEKYVEHLLNLSDGEGHGSPAKVKEVSAELLKLAKLEQKPTAWSEEDEEILYSIINDIEIRSGRITLAELKESYTKQINWLKSLKGRVQPQNLTISDEELAQVKKDAYNNAPRQN